ncbi:MAG: hypothetical protein CVU11_05710 [Bacteroidetes bacterium HGW-Bacteroidetes-6]|jgi:hypothetical protein|nr:MAG: hypothetical protein CVU11_05710 [Bacteroidetes bacterium HGW-Bacteroidetes-6]
MKSTLLYVAQWLFFVVGIVFSQTIGAQTAPVTGDGSAANPYQIANVSNLVWLSQNSTVWGQHFVQTADIDADTVTNWMPIGNSSTHFTGSYNGQGHSISNLVINLPSTNYVALFGYVKGTGVSNLAVIKNVSLKDFEVYGYDNVGALIGYSELLKIDSVIVSGSVNGHNQSGGLAGRCYASGVSAHVEILNSGSYCSVYSSNFYAGGLIGSNSAYSNTYSKIERCFSVGDISGINYVGGLIGINSGTSGGNDMVDNCYSRGDVTRISGSNASIGAFMGRNTGGVVSDCYSVGNVYYVGSIAAIKGFVGDEYLTGVYSNNFFDSTYSNQDSAIGASAKTTEEMKTACMYISAGWDFAFESANGANDYWNIAGFNNDGYPFLMYQELDATAPGSAVNFDGVDDYIVISNYSEINMTNNYTLEAWIKPESFTSMGGIISKYQSAGSNGYMFRLSDTAPYDGLTFDQMSTANGILTPGVWCHVAAVNDNGTRHLYLNGVEEPLSGTPLTMNLNTDNLGIGVDYISNPRFFDGDIDEVRVWDTVRTVCEIQNYMNTELTGHESGLVAYFNLNEGVPGANNTCQNKTAINKVNELYNGTLMNLTLTGDSSNWVLSGALLDGVGVNHDTTRPVITSVHPDQIINEVSLCQGILPDYITDMTATDPCDTYLNYMQVPAAGTFVSGNNNQIMLIASDNQGNADTVMFYVSVLDTVAPQITSSHPGQVLYADSNCEAVLPDYTGTVNAIDNCDTSVFVTQFPLAGGILAAAGTVVYLYVSDQAGNADTVSFPVFVSDTVAPVFSAYSGQIAYAGASCEAMIPDYSTIITAADNCSSLLSYLQVPAEGTILAGLNNQVILIAYDEMGNSDTAMFYVSVLDTIAPQIISSHPDQVLYSDANCESVLPDYTSALIATDNCDTLPAYSQIPAAGQFVSALQTTVALIATDNSGNADTVCFYVNLADTLNPNVDCLPDQDVNLAQGQYSYTVQGNGFDPVSVSDNCSIDNVYNSLNYLSTLDGEVLSPGDHEITWYAVDTAGNVDSCTFVITVNLYDAVTDGLMNTGISITPNPTSGELVIYNRNLLEFRCKITDASGRIISDTEISDGKTLLDLSGQADGLYLLQIYGDEVVAITRIVKN